MKKIFFVLISTLVFSTSVFAEKNFISMRAGGFFECSPSVGSFRDFVQDNIGGGISYNLGFNIPKTNFEIGSVFHCCASGGIIKSDYLDSFCSTKLTAGFFAVIPFGKSDFSFMPEINYGVLLNFPTVNSECLNADSVKKIYADQCLEAVLNFSFAPSSFCDGRLEFNLSPIYSVGFEKNNAVHSIGFRTGILYRFL